MSVYIFLLITAFLFLLFNYSRSLLPAVRTGRQNRGWPEHFYIRRDMLLPAVFMVILSFVAAFRFEVGRDYLEYREYFYEIIQNRRIVEPGFMLLCRVCNWIGGTPQLMFFTMSVATMLFCFLGIRRYSSSPMLSVFIFFCIGQMYLSTFNVIRQSLAAAMFLFSIQYILDKKLWKYLLVMLVAASFHASSLVLIPLYWVLDRRLPPVVIAIAAVAVVALPKIIVLVLQSTRYAVYGTVANFEFSITDYFFLIMSVLIFVFRKRVFLNTKYRTILNNINLVYGLIMLGSLLSSGELGAIVVMRMRYSFIFFYAIIIQLIVSDIGNVKLRSFVASGTVLILAALYIRTTLIQGAGYDLVPYRFSFQLFNL